MTKETTLTEADLAHFTGTEFWYRHPPNPKPPNPKPPNLRTLHPPESMRIATFRPLVLAAIVAMAAGCTTSRFYTPNTMQIPMLSHAQEATITGGVSKSDENSAWEAQAIYSPLPHLGVMVNHFSLHYSGAAQTDSSPFSFSESDYEGDTRLTEGGIGGYYQLGPNKEYLVSLFAGFGQGHTENRYASPPDLQNVETYISDWHKIH